MRLFVALNLPGRVEREVWAYMEKLRRSYPKAGRFSRRENLHLTAKPMKLLPDASHQNSSLCRLMRSRWTLLAPAFSEAAFSGQDSGKRMSSKK